MIQKSPALRITMSYLFASMALLSANVILYTLYDMVRDFRTLAGRRS
jgi:TRAP-type C4-dicarboxylate transport system permease small subunit